MSVTIKRLGSHPAQWTDDCCGKKDFDGELVSLSTRYWPRGGSAFIFDPSDGLGLRPMNDPDLKPSAHASIHLDGKGDEYLVLADKHFEGETEEEVKAAVEAWAAATWRRVVAALESEFGEAKED